MFGPEAWGPCWDPSYYLHMGGHLGVPWLAQGGGNGRGPHRQRRKSSGDVGGSGEGTSEGSKAGRSADPPMDDSQKTTIMLRNLPNDYTRQMLLDMLDGAGFCGKYDFVYLPIDFNRGAGLGYAFVNLMTHADAMEARTKFEGFADWKMSSQKVCTVAWGEPLQGYAAHVERYRDSPLMHETVPDEYKPALFKDGRRCNFPAPTKKNVRKPRIKAGRLEDGTEDGAGGRGLLKMVLPAKA